VPELGLLFLGVSDPRHLDVPDEGPLPTLRPIESSIGVARKPEFVFVRLSTYYQCPVTIST